MGKTTGFMEYERKDEAYIKPKERIKNYNEFTKPLKDLKTKVHAVWTVVSLFVIAVVLLGI